MCLVLGVYRYILCAQNNIGHLVVIQQIFVQCVHERSEYY